MSSFDKYFIDTKEYPREIIRKLNLYNEVEELYKNINNQLKIIREQNLKEFNEKDNLKEILMLNKKYSKELLALSDYKKELLEDIDYIIKTKYIDKMDIILEENNISCFCGKENFGKMIECEKCAKWFHYKCAKIKDKCEPDTWSCDNCRKLRTMKK